MSLKYRKDRINKIVKSWNLEKDHDLIANLKLDKNKFNDFKLKLKLYLSKALNISFEGNDDLFLKKIDKKRNYRKNVTPNGAVVPKREYQLEYNLLLREWGDIVRDMIGKDKRLLSIFRITPNIRIKFGTELKDNIGRGLSTSLPHSDAWVEGPWGMNCFFPILGDTKRNNLVFYEPKKGLFNENMLVSSKSYKEMQWVFDKYKILKFQPKKGRIYFSDYAMIHNTERKKFCGTRVSIDTTLYVGNHKPHRDRIKEYRKFIPKFGINDLVDPGKFENENHSEKKTVFSHYTSGSMRVIKII